MCVTVLRSPQNVLTCICSFTPISKLARIITYECTYCERPVHVPIQIQLCKERTENEDPSQRETLRPRSFRSVCQLFVNGLVKTNVVYSSPVQITISERWAIVTLSRRIERRHFWTSLPCPWELPLRENSCSGIYSSFYWSWLVLFS